MKVSVDVTQQITSRVGLPIGNGNAVVKDGDERPALLLRDVIVNSIDTPQAGDEKMNLAQKRSLDDIARAVLAQDSPTLEATEWAKVEERIGSSGYTINIVGEACTLMQPVKEKPEVKEG